MLVTYFVNFRWLNDHLFGKELFILFAASAFRKLSSIYVFSYFPFGFEGRIWDLIVSVPDHCLSFYFKSTAHLKFANCSMFPLAFVAGSLQGHFTAAGVVQCGGRKTSLRTATIVQFIFYFGPLRSATIF